MNPIRTSPYSTAEKVFVDCKRWLYGVDPSPSANGRSYSAAERKFVTLFNVTFACTCKINYSNSILIGSLLASASESDIKRNELKMPICLMLSLFVIVVIFPSQYKDIQALPRPPYTIHPFLQILLHCIQYIS